MGFRCGHQWMLCRLGGGRQGPMKQSIPYRRSIVGHDGPQRVAPKGSGMSARLRVTGDLPRDFGTDAAQGIARLTPTATTRGTPGRSAQRAQLVHSDHRLHVVHGECFLRQTDAMPWIPPTPTWSLVDLRPGVEVAPDLVRLAVDALDASRPLMAQSFLRALDWTAFESFWLEAGLESGRRHDNSAHTKNGDASKARAIPKSVKLAVAQRDGWRCRYCMLRVVSAPILKALQVQFPAYMPLGARAVDDHPAHRVIRCTQDHLVPHAGGGLDDPGNLVTSCGACNFQKGNCALDELSLRPPGVVP